jgi:hypothetical protein
MKSLSCHTSWVLSIEVFLCFFVHLFSSWHKSLQSVDRSISHPAIPDCNKVQQFRTTRVRGKRLSFGTRKVFSVTPSTTLIKIDFKFSDWQIKFTCTIKRGALPVLPVLDSNRKSDSYDFGRQFAQSQLDLAAGSSSSGPQISCFVLQG